jgi:hypothetical protein
VADWGGMPLLPSRKWEGLLLHQDSETLEVRTLPLSVLRQEVHYFREFSNSFAEVASRFMDPD